MPGRRARQESDAPEVKGRTTMPLEARFSDPEPDAATRRLDCNGVAARAAAALILQTQPF